MVNYTGTVNASGDPWCQWISVTTSSGTTNSTWSHWLYSTTASTNTVTTAPTCATDCYIWNCWNEVGQQNIRPQLSAEEQAAQAERWQAEAERQRKLVDAERLKREAAERRAQELLEANLDLEQRDRLRKDGHIFVCGKSGHRYRIRKGRSGNVDLVGRDGKITHTLCAHPREYVPDQDTMLAQKLMLEDDDVGFMNLANRSAYHGDGRPIMPALN